MSTMCTCGDVGVLGTDATVPLDAIVRSQLSSSFRVSMKGAVSEGGYMLFEILVALAILGGSMFVLLNAHYQAMRLHDTTVEELTAVNLLATALGQAEVEIMSGEEGNGGDFGKRFPDYSYTYDAQVDTENDPGLWTVTVTLKGPDGEHQMTAFMYDILRGQTPSAGGMQGNFGNELGGKTRSRTGESKTSGSSTGGSKKPKDSSGGDSR